MARGQVLGQRGEQRVPAFIAGWWRLVVQEGKLSARGLPGSSRQWSVRDGQPGRPVSSDGSRSRRALHFQGILSTEHTAWR